MFRPSPIPYRQLQLVLANKKQYQFKLVLLSHEFASG